MDRIERFYKINALLRSHTTVSFAKLLTSLDVSRSTLKRDLKYHCERLHNPIVHSRELGGFRLAATDAADKHQHELPGLWFSLAEIHALPTMQQLLAERDAGGILATHIAPLMERLNVLLGPEVNLDAAELHQRVHIIRLAQRSVQPRHFEQVATERASSPLRLVHYRDDWYLEACCHLRSAVGPDYGIFSGGALRWARLRFSPERARWVAQERWHPQQSGKFESADSYLLRQPYTDHRELIMDILKHGTHCEVLGPPSLPQVIGDEVKRLAEKYFCEGARWSCGEPLGA